MRVIAVRDSLFSDQITKQIGGKAIHKGSVYHVIEKFWSPVERFLDDPDYYSPSGTWFYKLLEIKGSHASPLFVELPEDYDSVEEITEEDKLIKTK